MSHSNITWLPSGRSLDEAFGDSTHSAASEELFPMDDLFSEPQTSPLGETAVGRWRSLADSWDDERHRVSQTPLFGARPRRSSSVDPLYPREEDDEGFLIPSRSATPKPRAAEEQSIEDGLPLVTELSFLEDAHPGHLTMNYPDYNGSISTIAHLDRARFTERCPLLEHVIEESRRSGTLTAVIYLDALTPATALAFVRFLYTGYYTFSRRQDNGESVEVFENAPTSLLLHCQMFHLGHVYDLSDLRTQAYVNVLRQCEFGCCTAHPPVDLAEAVALVYQPDLQLRKSYPNLSDAIVDYTVACFLPHHFASDPDLRRLIVEYPEFLQDISRQNFLREFRDESASAIIQTSHHIYIQTPRQPPPYHDMVWEIHGGNDTESEAHATTSDVSQESEDSDFPRPDRRSGASTPQSLNQHWPSSSAMDSESEYEVLRRPFNRSDRRQSQWTRRSRIERRRSVRSHAPLPLRPRGVPGPGANTAGGSAPATSALEAGHETAPSSRNSDTDSGSLVNLSESEASDWSLV